MENVTVLVYLIMFAQNAVPLKILTLEILYPHFRMPNWLIQKTMSKISVPRINSVRNKVVAFLLFICVRSRLVSSGSKATYSKMLKYK